MGVVASGRPPLRHLSCTGLLALRFLPGRDELLNEVLTGLGLGLAERAVTELARAHVHAHATLGEARASHLAGAAFPGRGRDDLAGRRVDQARGELDLGLAPAAAHADAL